MNLYNSLKLAFSRNAAENPRSRRLSTMVLGAATSLANRALGIITTLLSVPLTVRYLGAERFGAWVILASILAWLQLIDFGLGNGLINAVTSAAGRDRMDLVRIYISSALCMLTIIASATGLLAALAWPWIDWGSLLGVVSPDARAELGPALAAALIIFLSQFPLSITEKVFVAYQEGKIGNYWSIVANILSLVALLIVSQTRGGLLWLVIGVSGTRLLVVTISFLWLFLYHKPQLLPRFEYVQLPSAKSLTHAGGQFFLIQILALVTFQSDNLVISHYLGAASVPSYSLTYSIFNYTALPQSILFPYLWVSYTEAIARNDIAWVKRTFRINLIASVASTLPAILCLMFVARPFIGWWAGPTFVPEATLIGWMAAWSVINAITSPMACLFAAASHLRAQIIYSAFAAVINIVLSIKLVSSWGVNGVIAATVIGYSLFICVPAAVDTKLLFRKLFAGHHG
jgi:O-antigen/teichoic acid export membrane protein